MDTPQPFSLLELQNKCEGRRKDPFEAYLPEQPGFITDFVAGLFNSESPVLYTAWASIWALAMAIKREAWVQWFEDDPLFPNFYIILSGPPSNKKGKAIGRAIRVYQAGIGPIGKHLKGTERPPYHGKLTEPWALTTKTHVPILMDASTSRPLKEALDYRERRFYGMEFGLTSQLFFSDGSCWQDENGNVYQYTKTSELGIVAEELSTFMGRQQYNEGLVQLLLAIYSTDLEREDRTAMYGIIKMRGLCTNLLAGTTPTSFRDAVAETAKGDGFLSRTIIAHQFYRYQRFFPPPVWPFLPSVNQLAERLAWIAENTLGEHTLTEEASKYARTWYKRLHERLRARPDKDAYFSRADVSMLKLALIMKAQRYTPLGDNLIHLQDVKDAIRLLEATLATTPGIWSSDTAFRTRRVILEYLAMSSSPVKMQSLRKRLRNQERSLDAALNSLLMEGLIQLCTPEGEPVHDWPTGVDSEYFQLSQNHSVIPSFEEEEGFNETEH